jgi:hypothetical protein
MDENEQLVLSVLFCRCFGYLTWLRSSWKEKNLYTAMDENEQLVLSVLFAGVLATSPG